MTRLIRSFVRREGKITRGQQRALQQLLPKYGLSVTDGLVNYQQVFARTAPITLEIGFGDGDSLAMMARANPDIDYIGIEVYRPGVGRLLATLEREQINNVRVFCADAVEVLTTCIANASLDKIQIFFPDPWPKKRHHKRRLINPILVVMLVQKLIAGGLIHLATDWQDYAEHMLDVLRANDALINTAQGYAERPTDRPLTKFEQRGQKLGHAVWDLVFRVI